MRREKDFLGEIEIPGESSYGAQAYRAVINFPVQGTPFPKDFVNNIICVLGAIAQVNMLQGRWPEGLVRAYSHAATALLSDESKQDIVVGVFQDTSGRNLVANINEVLCNKTACALGGVQGDYYLADPLWRLESQYSYDSIFVCACWLSMIEQMPNIIATADRLRQAWKSKVDDFAGVLKIKRFQLQEVGSTDYLEEITVITAGFEALAKKLQSFYEDLWQYVLLDQAVIAAIIEKKFFEINRIGIEKEPVRVYPQFIEEVSRLFKEIALRFMQLAQYIRMASSGPTSGVGELSLLQIEQGWPLHPKSLILSGPEILSQIAFRLLGAETTISAAVSAQTPGPMSCLPVICSEILFGMNLMAGGYVIAAEKCVLLLKPTLKKCRENIEKSSVLASELAKIVGHERAVQAVKLASLTDRPLREVIIKMKLLTAEQIKQIF